MDINTNCTRIIPGFQWLDTTFGSSRQLKTALLKSTIGQVTLFPVYLTAMFFYLGKLEGLSTSDCIDKVKQGLPTTILAGSLLWPAVNVVNFMYVPVQSRVLYMNATGCVWNAYLSHRNMKTHNIRQDD